MIKRFFATPFYFQWLILFFVLHGYSDFIGHIALSSLLLLIIEGSAAAWVLFFASRKMYRDGHKAALLVSLLFFCYLFFGVIQDALAVRQALFGLSLFRTLIPVLALLCGAVFIGLFFYKRPLLKFTRFLNVLFLAYILYDAVFIGWRAGTMEKKNTTATLPALIPVADSLAKPDVYLILLDEYLGSRGLLEYYQYDNSPFESFLKQKGFHVCFQPRSNYRFTAYSMASLFSMRYLDSADLGRNESDTYKNLGTLINNNPVCEYFRRFHYSIHNYSPFAFAGIDASTSVTVLPQDIELITDRDAYHRFVKRIMLGEPQDRVNLSFVSTRLYKKVAVMHEKQLQAVLSAAGKSQPAFTYLHLLMPHKPFVYDSTGNMPDIYSTVRGNKIPGTDNLYLQYLVYTNKRMEQFIEQLFAATRGKAAIIIMSDHGYRDAHRIPGKDFSFCNFNAVYLPNRDYHLWYDSVSNVNQFPLLLNTLFGQRLPLKKDSLDPR